MIKITYVQPDGARRQVDAAAGNTVMEVAVKHDIPGIEAECGGACACATCHVKVSPDWRSATGSPGDMEEDMLDFASEVGEGSRLSCQISVTDDLDGLVVFVPSQQG